MSKRFRCHVGVCLALIEEGKVLLLKRAKHLWGGGKYALPGGGVDGEESLRKALVREMQEEVGISIAMEDVRLAHVQHIGPNENNHEEIVIFFFSAEKYVGTVENREPEKCDELGFFSLDDLPEDTLLSTQIGLGKMKEGEIYTEVFWGGEL